MGRPGPLDDHAAAGPHMKDAPSKSYRLAEFTYPILPPHQGGAMWFYSLPIHDALCHPAEKLYRDYLGAVKFGNIFSLDVGPDYAGRLREIDVQTLRKVGEMIRSHLRPSEETSYRVRRRTDCQSVPVPLDGLAIRPTADSVCCCLAEPDAIQRPGIRLGPECSLPHPHTSPSLPQAGEGTSGI